MKRAVVSDIHGNLEALHVVLDHIDKQGVDEILCLGDVIGYGPNPRECLKVALDFGLCLKGNHESAVLNNAEDFNDKARIALDWTRDQLSDRNQPREENNRFWVFLDELPERKSVGDALLVHGSPRDPVREYVLPRDARDTRKMREIFSLIDNSLCFIGHSHVPGVYTEDGQFYSPARLQGGTCPLGRRRLLVNVGSVGQPRDGDPRASYVIWEDDSLTFHRLEYDFRLTMNKVIETGVLPRYLADRLQVGR